ncbi:MAG: DUF488 family protein [Candidatus Zixiibacteriota bacterium]
MRFYTIGYGGRSPEEFVKLLRERSVKTVVDIRLRPERAHLDVYRKSSNPHKGIQGLLEKGGIGYVWLAELGNIFLEYENWRGLYSRLFEKSGDLLTKRLFGVAMPVCLMCAEKQVRECHRGVIADYLASNGHVIEHIE